MLGQQSNPNTQSWCSRRGVRVTDRLAVMQRMIGQVGRGWFLVTSELEQRVRYRPGDRQSRTVTHTQTSRSGGKVGTTEFSTLD
jgi:hypothetical protein